LTPGGPEGGRKLSKIWRFGTPLDQPFDVREGRVETLNYPHTDVCEC
jgi:hypothetical protein